MLTKILFIAIKKKNYQKMKKQQLFKIFVTDSISLQLLTLNHTNELFTCIQKNKEFLSEWLAWVKKVKNVKDSEKKILKDQDDFYKKDSLELEIFENNKLIGRIGFISISERSAEIGYWLDKDFNGKGIMTTCVKKLVEYAFNETSIFRIEIKMDPKNTKSKNIPERAGFFYEGRKRGDVFVKGEPRDSLVYSYVKTDLLK